MWLEPTVLGCSWVAFGVDVAAVCFRVVVGVCLSLH